ncbi:MAG: chemotaxis protein CheW [Cyanobacteriota bacterium]|nr:chemotaxis protein CheW [Cyanobacteriota bacterium]
MNSSALTSVNQPTQKAAGDPYLKIRLTPQVSALLPMPYLQEVLTVPVGRIAPMPGMSPCVLGLLNRRSRVLWTIDLARLLGIESTATKTGQYSLVIARVGSMPLGMVVGAVEGIARASRDRLESPHGSVSAGLVPYLRGCVLLASEVSLVLDVGAIVRSPALQNY